MSALLVGYARSLYDEGDASATCFMTRSKS